MDFCISHVLRPLIINIYNVGKTIPIREKTYYFMENKMFLSSFKSPAANDLLF